MAEQLPLDYETQPTSQIVQGEANVHAIRALKRADWPSGRVAVIGPERSGKSTLALALLQAGGSAVGTAEGSLKLMSGHSAPILVLDNFHRFIKTDGSEEAFFHLLNRTLETGQKVAIFSRTPLDAINIKLADLRSRLGTFETLVLGLPDDAMLTQLIAKNFEMRGILVQADVIDYLAKRVERTYVAVEQAVLALDQMALQAQGKITKARVKAYLETLDED